MLVALVSRKYQQRSGLKHVTQDLGILSANKWRHQLKSSATLVLPIPDALDLRLPKDQDASQAAMILDAQDRLL